MPALPSFDVCDYVIIRVDEEDRHLNVLKLHKLLYYCQAWSLAFGDGRLIDAQFQAWVHGPVCRPIYNRYAATKALYSSVSLRDVSDRFKFSDIPKRKRITIDVVVEKYAPLSGDQLEQMTHGERPWREARDGLPDDVRSEAVISEETMREYYSGRLKKSKKRGS